MTEVHFEFDQAFAGATEAPSAVKSCCQFEQRLEGLAAVIKERSAPAEWISKEMRALMDSFPPTLVGEERQAINNLVNNLHAQVMTAAAGNQEMKSLAVSSKVLVQWTDLQVKMGEAGNSPTVHQQREIAKTAETVKALLEQKQDIVVGRALQEVRSVAEAVIKHTEATHPLWSAAFSREIAPGSQTKVDEKKAPAEQGKAVESRRSIAEIVSGRETSPGAALPRGSAVVGVSEPSKVTDATRSGPVVEARETPRAVSSSEARRSESPAPQEMTSAQVVRQEAPSSGASSSLSREVVARTVVSQPSSSPQHVSSGASQSAARLSPALRMSSPSPASLATRSPISSPVVRGSQSREKGPSGMVLSGPVRKAANNGANSSVTRVTAGGRPALVARAERIIVTGRGRGGSLVNKSAVGSSRKPDVVSQGAGVRQLGRDSRSPHKHTYARAPREKTISADVRGERSISAVAPAAIRRIVALIAQARPLSLKELRSIRAERHERPSEMRVVVAVRERADRLIERVRAMPLKELAKMRPGRSDMKTEVSRKISAPTSLAERIAWREVRAYVRSLQQRLQGIINPGSQLYKRLTTELTLSDLERLLSIIGGARAVKGMRRKQKAGELGQVSEADISNAFVSQLVAAAGGPPSSSNPSGGAEDVSPSESGASPESSPVGDVEEATLVADGATPTATLTTVLVKEETGGNAIV